MTKKKALKAKPLETSDDITGGHQQLTTEEMIKQMKKEISMIVEVHQGLRLKYDRLVNRLKAFAYFMEMTNNVEELRKEFYHYFGSEQ